MLEALWSVEFISNLGATGAGVVVLETERVLGGDAQYIYVGSYNLNPSTGLVTAQLKVTHFAGQASSVFGNAREFNLQLSGKPNIQQFEFHGQVVERPDLEIGIRLTRRAELP